MISSAGPLSVVPQDGAMPNAPEPGMTVALAWDHESRKARLHVSHWATGDSVEFAVELGQEQAQYVYCRPLDGAPAESLPLAG